MENKPEMTRVGQVRAVDRDGSPAYSRVTYALRDVSAEFELDAASGELYTSRPLDRELESVYRLVACAHDADRPSRSRCVNASVVIEDLNDNYPVAFERIRVKLSSDSPVGTVLTRIVATDPDSGVNARLLYSVVSSPASNGDGEQLFDVDSSTGSVTLIGSIPVVETLPHPPQQFSLDVAVSDSGQPPLTTLVHVTIELVAPKGSSFGGGATAASSHTENGNVNLALALSVFGGVFFVTLVMVAVIVVFVRFKMAACCRRKQSKMAAVSDVDEVAIDDQTLAELYNDLSRSLDLVARRTLGRSHDLARSVATLSDGRVPATSTWLSSPDCSAVTVPATPTISLASHNNCRLPMKLRRLSSEDDGSVTSEFTSECTDSGRGHSARLSS